MNGNFVGVLTHLFANVALVHRWLVTNLADDGGNAFRAHLRRVLAAGRNLAVIAGTEKVRLAIAGYGDLAPEHHDPHIEIMGVHVLGETGLLPAMHDFEAFAPQIAFEGVTGERAAIAAAA